MDDRPFPLAFILILAARAEAARRVSECGGGEMQPHKSPSPTPASGRPLPPPLFPAGGRAPRGRHVPGPGGKGRHGRNGCNRNATARGEPLGPAGAGCAARTLTLPQAALEVGVAAPLAVEVDAVPDEERPA